MSEKDSTNRELLRQLDNLRARAVESEAAASEQKAARRAAVRERDQFEALLDLMTDGVYITNLDHDMQYANPALIRAFGPLAGKKCYQYLHNRGVACPWCENEQLEIAEPICREFTFEATGKTYDLTEMVLQNPDGSRSKIAVFHDITELKRALTELGEHKEHLEEMVRERTEHLEQVRKTLAAEVVERKRAEQKATENARILDALFEDTVTPLVILDREFNFARVNAAYADACGRDISEFAGWNHFEMYPSDAKVIFETVVETKQSFEATARPFEFADHPEWGVTYWDWTLVPLLDDQGEVEYLVYSLKDVTQRVRAMTALEEVQEELRAYAARVESAREDERKRIGAELHDDLGQDLALLKLELAQLRDWISSRSRSALRKELIQRTEEVIATLDKSVSTLRHISTELFPAVLHKFGLVEAIQWQAREFQKRTGIACVPVFSDDAIELDAGTSTAMFRIVQEALTNVARHAGATRVVIRAHPEGDRLVFTVEDNGRGINEQDLGGLTSLGVTGMREKALAAGATFSIAGVAGKGTVVTVTVPRAGAAASRADSAGQEDQSDSQASTGDRSAL
jgi:PAS domain S-box-containing protein